MKVSARHWIVLAFLTVGFISGLFLSLPDGKLHIIFCDVGQGDAIYLTFPNGGDMLIDSGPNSKVLTCLGKHMRFFDREIDVVLLTHPDKDHLGGLSEVLQRYTMKHFISVPVKKDTKSFAEISNLLQELRIPIKYSTTYDQFTFGAVKFSVIWPERAWLQDALTIPSADIGKLESSLPGEVLAYSSDTDSNVFSIYLHLQYGTFDALFTGDGDRSTQQLISKLGLSGLLPREVEVLKVPHHGSKTGMTSEFLDLIQPQVSVIQVGKNNTYGHPTSEAMKALEQYGKVLRTDQMGDIEVVSDGENWEIKSLP